WSELTAAGIVKVFAGALTSPYGDVREAALRLGYVILSRSPGQHLAVAERALQSGRAEALRYLWPHISEGIWTAAAKTLEPAFARRIRFDSSVPRRLRDLIPDALPASVYWRDCLLSVVTAGLMRR